THPLRRLCGELAVVVGRTVPQLPGPVHLVAEAPHLHAERLVTPIDPATLTELGSPGNVGVLEKIERLQRAPGAQVDREHEVAAHLLQPRRELMQSDLVRLSGVPGQIQSARTLLPRPD